METISISEGNAAILIYMGYVKTPKSGGQQTYYDPEKKISDVIFEIWPAHAGYDSDWRKLMPVVTKIILHKYDDGDRAFPRTFGMRNEETGMMMVRFNRCPLFEARTLHEATWLAVVDFCKDEIQKDQP